MLDAMHMQKNAWQDVKQSSIVNCFSKAGFVPSLPEDDNQDEQTPDGMSVDMNSSLECHGILTDDNICASVRQKTNSEPDSDDKTSDESHVMQYRLWGPLWSNIMQISIAFGDPSAEAHH